MMRWSEHCPLLASSVEKIYADGRRDALSSDSNVSRQHVSASPAWIQTVFLSFLNFPVGGQTRRSQSLTYPSRNK